MSFLTEDYDYVLPEELIAKYPLARRDESRMLVLHRAEQRIEHRRFADFPSYLRAGDLVVLNDTRVIPARVFSDDGRIEFLFLENLHDDTWKCLVKPGRKMRLGARTEVRGVAGVVTGIEPEGERIIEFQGPVDLDAAGELPIPPVIVPPADEPAPEPDKERSKRPEPFVFAFDSFNNFANSNSDRNEVSPWISSIDIWGPAMLPLAPIYSGAANPGATLVIDLYNANGVHIGSQTVIADAGGNWLANFTSVVLRDAPSEVRITQVNAPYSFGSGTGHNLRTYYAPAALNPGHFLGQTVQSVLDNEPAPLLGGLDLANPIALGPVKYGGEFLASEGVASSN